MPIGLRLLRVFAATVLCILLFAGFFELFLMIWMNIAGSLGRGGPNEWLPVRAVFGWAMVFRAPGYLILGTIPLTAIAFTLDRLGKSHPFFYITFWVIAGIVATRNPIGSLLVGSLCGYIYWFLAGKKAGQPGADTFAQRWRIRPIFNVIGYLFVGFLAYQLAGLLYGGGKLLWVTVNNPGLGTPPYMVRYERENTARLKVALMEFPDPVSCLESTVENPTGETLKLMDWSKIDNSVEARVCIFRLLHSYGDVTKATDWLEAQGFKSGNGFSSMNPHIGRDGSLWVHAGWSIRNNGPKFPTRGAIRRKFASIPYGMNVTTEWSSDGQELVSVGIDMNTL